MEIGEIREIGEIGVKLLLVIGIMVILAVILALPTMLLWNWLMPPIFGIKAITFWQALGINLLCGFLFKSGGK